MRTEENTFRITDRALVISKVKYTFTSDMGECVIGIIEGDLNTGYLGFPKSLEDRKGKLEFEFNLVCEKDTDVHFLIYPGVVYDVYLNGEHICTPYGNLPYSMLKLNHGENKFKITMPYKENGSVFIRLNSYENEIKNTESSILFDNIRSLKGEVAIIKEKKIISPGEKFQFSVWPHDRCGIDIDRGYEVTCAYLDKELDISADFCEDITVAGDFTKEKPTDEIEQLTLKLRMYLRDGQEMIKTYRIFVIKDDESCFNIAKRAERLLSKKNEFSNEVRSYLIQAKKEFENYDVKKCSPAFMYDAYKDIVEFEMGNCEKYKNRRGAYTMYREFEFASDIFPCHIFVPRNYDPSHKYPLLLLCTISPRNNFSRMFDMLDEEVIAVDVSGRGITTGSYIGEASFLETLNFILGKFSIDEERIYLVGHSNGAFTAWAMAQAYPHLFAGILTCSGAMFKDKIRNVSNIPVINISSTHDYMLDSVRLTAHEASQIDDYTYIECDGVPHAKLAYMKGKKSLLKKLMSNKRRLYPWHIRYYTDRERHNRAYWVRIDGIACGHRHATIKVDTDGNTVTIRARGCMGLTVNPPPYINRHRFTITINNRVFNFSDEQYGEIYFKHDGNGFILAESPVNYCGIKGTGVLDVYLDPLRVFSASEELDDIARTYAEPKTNGYNPNIHVSYPVVKMYDADIFTVIKQFGGCSAVVVDSCEKAPILEMLRCFCHIKTDEKGYEYMGKRYEGKYCIIQILDNPFSQGHHILYINSNDSKVRNSVVFNRRLMIPSYANGLHNYLNNLAMIRSESEYFKVIEPDSALENI